MAKSEGGGGRGGGGTTSGARDRAFLVNLAGMREETAGNGNYPAGRVSDNSYLSTLSASRTDEQAVTFLRNAGYRIPTRTHARSAAQHITKTWRKITAKYDSKDFFGNKVKKGDLIYYKDGAVISAPYLDRYK